MKTSRTRSYSLAALAALALAWQAPATAAVLPITAVTIDPAPVSGSLTTNAMIQSVTIGGEEYTALESVQTVTFAGNRNRMWATGGTDPGSDGAAVVGLDYGTGVLNVGGNTKFNFGRTLGLDETFFIIRDGTVSGSEFVTFQAIDLAGQVIGNYERRINTTAYGLLSPTVNLQRESGANLLGRDRDGISFKVSDLQGTVGDISQIAGLQVKAIDQASAWDVTAVGIASIAVIPEPASLVLLALGGACCLTTRRARR